jgi:hypothetical protein
MSVIAFDDHLKIETMSKKETATKAIEEMSEYDFNDNIFIPETIEEEMKAKILVRMARKLSLDQLECIEREWGTKH